MPRYIACSPYSLPFGNFKKNFMPNPNVAVATLSKFRNNVSLQIQNSVFRLSAQLLSFAVFPSAPVPITLPSASPSFLSYIQTTCSRMTDGHNLIFCPPCTRCTHYHHTHLLRLFPSVSPVLESWNHARVCQK
jgi:hypothetical protein